jgi:hypothetical protein
LGYLCNCSLKKHWILKLVNKQRNIDDNHLIFNKLVYYFYEKQPIPKMKFITMFCKYFIAYNIAISQSVVIFIVSFFVLLNFCIL